jgi:predicted Zn-dependent protease
MRPFYALALSLLFVCCGGGFANGLQEHAADQLLPVEQENELGAQLAAELDAELTMHPGPDVQAYIAALDDQAVVIVADRAPEITFRFYVVQDDVEVGFRYQVVSGFDPRGFVDFFGKIEGGPRSPEFLSSYPNPDNRIEATEAMLDARDGWPDKRNTATFLEFQRQL